MARAKTKPTAAPASDSNPGPKWILKSKGPLGPSETEVILYAGLKSGEIVETPADFAIRSRAVSNLITDRSDIAAKIAHQNLHQVTDVPSSRSRLLDIGFSRRESPAENNQAAIAGSVDLINSSLGDAIKIVLFLDGEDTTVPAAFSDWKISKPDKRTTPPSITLACF